MRADLWYGRRVHHDPVAVLVLYLAIILGCAKLGGDIAVRLKQPPVLGELLAGVVIGNLHLAGIDAFTAIGTDQTLDIFARLGVIILLFEVGLESTVSQMMKVGLSALLVATVGVITTFGLGYVVCILLLPHSSFYANVFIAAALCPTSVGITARVLKDLSAINTTEARVVLGAAVIDDVQGLILLAVVSGLIAAADTGVSPSALSISFVVVKAAVFLIGAIALGVLLSRRFFQLASKLRARSVLLATGLSICFVLAWAADAIGLAPLVGAFAAGLILEDIHYVDFTTRGEQKLEELVAPISSIFVPVFFVLMGMKTDLTVFADPGILALAALLTLAVVVGKQLCSLTALKPKDASRLSRFTIGVGMIPRGEVGLIFANVGLTMTVGGVAVVTPSVFSAIVIMVILTTIITPPALRVALGRRTPPTPEPVSSPSS